MSADYQQLLDASIQHLQELKAHGRRYVNLAPETLAALSQPPLRGTAPVVPSPARAPAPVPPTRRAVQPSPTPVAPAPSPTVVPLPVPLPAATAVPTDKVQAMAALRQRALVCVKCPHLVAARKNVVVGVGDPNSPLLFVGEAPGADEDRQGEPFVGAAGQLLTKIIQTMGLSRQTVFIANILKCRPDMPGQASGNRPPTEEEMETCIPWLLEQIDIIQPKVIVALGATAVKGLLHIPTGITRLRGNWQTFRGIPTMPTYHPAYLLRNQALSEKRRVWEDMLAVMEKLGMPISEKQRGYFLKG